MATAKARDVIVASVVLITLAACNPTPSPRGAANQGTAPSTDRTFLNAPYYTGGDPDHRAKGGRGGGS
jgi:hypothetical protein